MRLRRNVLPLTRIWPSAYNALHGLQRVLKSAIRTRPLKATFFVSNEFPPFALHITFYSRPPAFIIVLSLAVGPFQVALLAHVIPFIDERTSVTHPFVSRWYNFPFCLGAQRQQHLFIPQVLWFPVSFGWSQTCGAIEVVGAVNNRTARTRPRSILVHVNKVVC